MSGEGPPLLTAIEGHTHRVAVIDGVGEHTYADLLGASEAVASWLLDSLDVGDLAEARVALMIPPGFEFVVGLLGAWRAGGIAVPLCVSHPAPELAYVLDDTRPAILLAHPETAGVVSGLAAERGIAFAMIAEATGSAGRRRPPVPASRRALILHTSGTTGRPKGAVMTHASLAGNITSMVEAWEWSTDDHILHVLPLHHTHGIVNALLCALWVGATCEMMPAFDAESVWERFVTGGPTLFMAVPTIYRRLLRAWEASTPGQRVRMSEAAGTLRLLVSGSAALPVPLFERWREITGQSLLERYGMTEIGMALSNPLHGERRAGSVGRPLPGVEVRLVDPAGNVLPPEEGATGEIEVRGAGVFLEYWGRRRETGSAFRDGWFRTGDEAIIENGTFRILGRQSVDIIKTGGYKVSALEIESVLAEHPDVSECAVVGIPDAEWGEAVCAALVTGRELSREELRSWAALRMARYKIPTRVRCVAALPRNAMGKVSKTAVREWFETGSEAGSDRMIERGGER